MSDIKDRIKRYAHERFNENVTQFEVRCGTKPTSLNSMKEGLSSKLLSQISSACPDLNLRWLLLGEGSMLITADLEVNLQKKEEEIHELKIKIRSKEDQYQKILGKLEAYQEQYAILMEKHKPIINQNAEIR